MKANYEKNKVASFAEVWECPTTSNKSLHATAVFSPGDVLSNFAARETLSKPNYLSIQIDEFQHILLEPDLLQYVNHSCNPNIFFDTSNMTVNVLRKIEIGEEITFFYPSTEWCMDRGFNCNCGSKNCLERIQGAVHLPLNILTQYRLSQHIHQKLVLLG